MAACLLLATFPACAQTDSALSYGIQANENLLRSQEDLSLLEPPPSVGVPRYIPPSETHYRLLFGAGGNAGLRNDAPISYIGSASYQLEHHLFSASFIASVNNARQPPRNAFMEFDLLYGYAFDEILPRYEASHQSLHLALSAGLGFDTYSERWRFRRRDTSFSSYPNTFQYALGFPVQLVAMYEPFRFAGIGLMLFTDFNKIAPNYGGTLMLEFRM